MTVLYEVVFDGGLVVTTSEAKARKRAQAKAREIDGEVKVLKVEVPDKRDLDWLCRLMSTEDFDTGGERADCETAEPVEVGRNGQ